MTPPRCQAFDQRRREGFLSRVCPLLSAAGPFTHSWLQQTHTQQRDTALDSLDEDLPHDVCVCVPGEYWGGGGLHRSAVLEEKQDTAPHLVLSHVLCMPAMSGRDPGCVCELRGTHCINTVLSPERPKLVFICTLRAKGDVQGPFFICPG